MHKCISFPTGNMPSSFITVYSNSWVSTHHTLLIISISTFFNDKIISYILKIYASAIQWNYLRVFNWLHSSFKNRYKIIYLIRNKSMENAAFPRQVSCRNAGFTDTEHVILYTLIIACLHYIFLTKNLLNK